VLYLLHDTTQNIQWTEPIFNDVPDKIYNYNIQFKNLEEFGVKPSKCVYHSSDILFDVNGIARVDVLHDLG
jgi:hypothetical protein